MAFFNIVCTLYFVALDLFAIVEFNLSIFHYFGQIQYTLIKFYSSNENTGTILF